MRVPFKVLFGKQGAFNSLLTVPEAWERISRRSVHQRKDKFSQESNHIGFYKPKPIEQSVQEGQGYPIIVVMAPAIRIHLVQIVVLQAASLINTLCNAGLGAVPGLQAACGHFAVCPSATNRTKLYISISARTTLKEAQGDGSIRRWNYTST